MRMIVNRATLKAAGWTELVIDGQQLISNGKVQFLGGVLTGDNYVYDLMSEEIDPNSTTLAFHLAKQNIMWTTDEPCVNETRRYH